MGAAPRPATSPGALDELRAVTRDLHLAVEAASPLAGDDLAGYVAHLRWLRPWLGGLEGWLAGLPHGPATSAAAPLIARLPWLDDDLRRAGHPPAAAPLAAPAWVDGTRPGFAWGVFYVIEGSQLGGAVIRRRMGARPPLDPMRYLEGSGHAGERWRTVTAELERVLAAAPDRAAACEGAAAAFAGLLP